MRRLGRLSVDVLPVLPSPEQLRYRNKVQVPFQPAPPPRGFAAGFYMPGTHTAVDFDDCIVQPESSVAIVRAVKELARRFRWEPYAEDKDRGWLRHLYARTNRAGQALVAFVTRHPRFPNEKEAVKELLERIPSTVSIWQNVQERRTSVVLGRAWRKLHGSDTMAERIGETVLEFSPGAFLQVNTAAAEVLYAAAEERLFKGGFKPKLVLDLYSGIGAIAFWLAPKVPRVIGMEEVYQAVEDAYYNARRLGFKHVDFLKGKVEHSIRQLREVAEPPPWAVVADPPRAGCEPAVLRSLSDKRVHRVVYISCNPATFARDARILCDKGFVLGPVQPVDLFPQTSHVELVAAFDRG